jgi:CYTH domain-containing protein
MAKEIERKYLIDQRRWECLKPTIKEFEYLRQGYLTVDEFKTIRVRVSNERAFLTIKGKTMGITRLEFEYIIPREDGILFLDEFAHSELEKVRYRLKYEEKVWEIDEFLGANCGLVLAEVELSDENETVLLPDWVVIEVSHDERYYNTYLSQNPYSAW